MTLTRSRSVFAMAAAGLLWGSGSSVAIAQGQSSPPTVSADRSGTLADISSGNAIVTFRERHADRPSPERAAERCFCAPHAG